MHKYINQPVFDITGSMTKKEQIRRFTEDLEELIDNPIFGVYFL